MRVISRKRLRVFAELYPDSQEPLDVWYRLIKARQFESPVEVRQLFGSASFLGHGRTVFNIGGNKYRLVTHVRYDLQRIFVKAVMTHAEYDAWSKDNR